MGRGIEVLVSVLKKYHFYPKTFFFVFSRAAPLPYGGSQARGLIRAVAASLRQSHSNAKSNLHL